MGAVVPVKLRVRKNGSLVAARPQLNFIEGSNITLTVTDDGTDNEVDVTIAVTPGVGTGDFVGPSSATNNALVLFDGTTGKLGKNSTAIFDPATSALSGVKVDPTQTVLTAGSEGRVPFFNNTSSANGLGTNANFLFNSALNGLRFGPTLSDTFTVYTVSFLSRFWALSIDGFDTTFILEHIGTNEPVMMVGKASGTIGTRGDVADTNGLGSLYFAGYKTGTFNVATQIQTLVDGTPALFNMPGRLLLKTTKSGDVLPSTVLDMRASHASTFDGGLQINTGGYDQDSSIAGDTDANCFYLDASTDRIGIGTSSPSVKFHVNGASLFDGATTINEAGAAVDFRVEGDTLANLFFLQGSTDRIGINQASPSVLLDVNGNVNFDGTVVFNESGADKDARFEGDTDANLFFLDASADRVGMGTASPAHKLDVNGTFRSVGIMTSDSGKVRSWSAKTGAYTILDSDDMVEFAPSSGGLTGTLPAASSVALGHTFRFFSGTAVGAGNTVTIARAGSDTVNGGASVAVSRASIEFTVVKTGTTTWRLYQ